MPRNRLEESICITFMDFVRLAESTGHMRGYSKVFHIPNGQRAGSSNVSRRIAGGIEKRMGVWAGVADYCVICDKTEHFTFTWVGFLEAKRPGEDRTPKQKKFKEWTDEMGIKNEIFFTPEEGIDLLIGYGAILPSFTAHKR